MPDQDRVVFRTAPVEERVPAAQLLAQYLARVDTILSEAEQQFESPRP